MSCDNLIWRIWDWDLDVMICNVVARECWVMHIFLLSMGVGLFLL